MALSLAAGGSWAACTYPPSEVDIPDGASASEAEMGAAQGEVKTFLADMQAYLDCLEKEAAAARAAAEAAGEELNPEQEALHVKRHNAAVDAMHAVAEEFNVEVREFKARNSR